MSVTEICGDLTGKELKAICRDLALPQQNVKSISITSLQAALEAEQVTETDLIDLVESILGPKREKEKTLESDRLKLEHNIKLAENEAARLAQIDTLNAQRLMDQAHELKMRELEAENALKVLEQETALRISEQENALKIREIEAQKELGLRKLDLEMQQNAAPKSKSFNSPVFKLLKPWDAKDKTDVAEYLLQFERTAKQAHLSVDEWTLHLQPLMGSVFTQICAQLSDQDAQDYEKVKLEILKQFKITTEAARLKFRGLVKDAEITYSTFAFKLRAYLNQWLENAEAKGDLDQFVNLILLEQFWSVCPVGMKLNLQEKSNVKTLEEVALAADEYTARRQATQLEKDLKSGPLAKANTNLNSNGNASSNGQQKANGSNQQRNGGPKQTPKTNSNQNNSSQNGNSNNKKTQPNEQKQTSGVANHADKPRNDPKSGRCWHCEQVGHIKSMCPKLKSSTVNLVREIESPEYVLQKYITEWTVNGQPCKVLRDTASTDDVIDRKLVRPDQFTGEYTHCRNALTAQTTAHAIARVTIETPYGPLESEALVTDHMGPHFQMLLGVPSQAWLEEKGMEAPPPLSNAITRSQTKEQQGRVLTCSPDLPISAPSRETEEPDVDEPDAPEINVEEDLNMHKAKTTPLSKEEEGIILGPSDKTFLDLLAVNKEEFAKLQKEDASLKLCWEAAKLPKNQQDPSKMFFVDERGILFRTPIGFDHKPMANTQLVMPSKCRPLVLHTAHSNAWAGHLGKNKTQDRILSQFYWPRIFSDTEEYVASCLTCQRNGKAGKPKVAPLVLVPMVTEPMMRQIIDIVGPIRPKSKAGYQYILTLLDPATKFPEAIPLVKADSLSVVNALLTVFCRIGFPGTVQSDLGSCFVSELTTLFLEKCGIKQVHSSVCHPQSNSVERFHRTLKAVLRAVTHEHPHDWERCLPGAMFALRTAAHETTGFTPSELVYGRNLRGPLDLLREHWVEPNVHPSVLEHVLDLLQRFQYSRELALENAVEAQLSSKSYYDRKAEHRSFKVGDLVMVLRPSRTNKLEIYWEGPNKVLEVMSDTNYLVERSSGRGKPTLYHINLLKPYIARHSMANHLAGSEAEPDTFHEWTGQPGDGAMSSEQALASFKKLGPITPEQTQDLIKIFDQVDGVFSTLPGRTHLVTHDITLKPECEGKPLQTRYYRHGQVEKDLIIKEVNRMKDLGLLRESDSPHSSPMIIVCKEGAKPRPVADYRWLNELMETRDHPIPNIDECLEKAARWKYIAVFDLNRGFWQVNLTERASRLAAISTPIGKFEPLIMNMGMKNAPFCFQKLMEQICQGMEQFTTPFQDDTAVGANTWPEFLQNVLTFLTAVKDAGLTVNAIKTQVACDKVTYLGHEIGLGCRSPSEIKIQAVKDFQRPVTKTDIRSFLGLCGYYQRYIPQYSEICAPLTDATGKNFPDPIIWDDQKQKAFETLKQALISKPVLRAPDFSQPFIVQTDCSDRGMGVLLSQDFEDGEHPCLYMSRKLTPREQNYAATEKECACIVWGVAKLRPYLYGTKFTIVTDHNPLSWLKNMANKNGRLLRWSLMLQDLDYEVRYKKGKEHCNADALSRYFV